MRTERIFTWAGSAMMVVAGIGFFGSGLFPPIAPHAGPLAVVHLYSEHPTRMRAGLLLSFVAFAGWGPWVAATTTQLRRIPNISPSLANAQSVAGATAWVFLVGPMLIFSTVAFRPMRDAAVLQGLNDLGWITFIMAIVPFIMMAVFIAVAVLQDQSETPLFPRWFGYLNLWIALLEVPGGFLLFFHVGLLDWRGLLALWIPFAAFATWIFSVSYTVDHAIKRADAGAPSVSGAAAGGAPALDPAAV